MARWDATGSWAGEFWYSPDPAFADLPQPVGFTLTARQGWFGRFRGAVRDDPIGGSAPEEAAVAGRAAGGRLWFRKRYPACYVWAGGRLATLGEQMEASYGLRLDRDPPAAPIRYRGEFEADGQAAGGQWEVPADRVRCRSGGRVVVFEWPGCAGGWRMRRLLG
jgi:hypothetical protein